MTKTTKQNFENFKGKFRFRYENVGLKWKLELWYNVSQRQDLILAWPAVQVESKCSFRSNLREIDCLEQFDRFFIKIMILG